MKTALSLEGEITEDGHLLVDLPPGSEAASDLLALVPNLTGAVAVTIPTEESRVSVERTMISAREAGVELIGVVENMGEYACGSCGTSGPLFRGGAGKMLSEKFEVPLMGSIPFVSDIQATLSRTLASGLENALAR